ncbi:4'-phosphopantetheinyl transferase family protein [Salinicola sp. V024]|uniref:4'-phosphopantetheinyl transferase family protein n=1 Tax=Salinicola sp. V024 TaxID=3459609 RepID=UPI00404441BB
MPDPATAIEPLPPGCHSRSCEWPWRRPFPGAQFSALRFETEALCDIDPATWHVSLPSRLETAAAKRRAEFVCGRLAARHALGALTGSRSTPAQDVERLPDWPAGTVGSITHSRGLAAAVVARRPDFEGVGLDAEVMMSAERARRLAPQILVGSEQEWFERLAVESQGEFVTLVFSLKESLFKALYPLVRRRFYFPDARLIAWDAREGSVTIELLKTLSSQWPAGSRLFGHVTAIDEYLLTLIMIQGK